MTLQRGPIHPSSTPRFPTADRLDGACDPLRFAVFRRYTFFSTAIYKFGALRRSITHNLALYDGLYVVLDAVEAGTRGAVKVYIQEVIVLKVNL